MKSKMLILFAALIVSPCTFASNSDQNVNYAEFEKYVERLMTEFQVPGLAVGVVSKTSPLYMKGFGVRGIDKKLPVTADTQFAIGSTSKAFTATALGLLVDQKLVEWDKPVKSHYLPDFQMYDSTATQLVTIRDMLTHRTGLPRHDLVWYGTPLNREEIYQRIKHLTPTAGIREKAQYQNIMFMTAGYLLGKKMNTSWEDFVAENIFNKLGMANSNFSVTDMQKSPDFALPHAVINGQPHQIPFRNIDAVGPAGSINSSVNDMGKWLQLQLNEGRFNETQIISKEALAEIHRPQMVSSIMGFDKLFEELGAETYAMAWFSQPYLHKKLIHHGGGIDGFITFVGFLPELDIGIVVFGNSGSLVPYIAAFAYMDLLIKGNIGPWEERLRNLMKPKAPNLVEGTTAPFELEKYVGVYSHPAYGNVTMSKSVGSDSLEFAHYVLAYKLGHLADHSFLPIQENNKLDKSVHPITFVPEASGAITSLSFKADDLADPIVFHRQAGFRNFMTIEPAPRANVSPNQAIESFQIF